MFNLISFFILHYGTICHAKHYFLLQITSNVRQKKIMKKVNFSKSGFKITPNFAKILNFYFITQK